MLFSKQDHNTELYLIQNIVYFNVYIFKGDDSMMRKMYISKMITFKNLKLILFYYLKSLTSMTINPLIRILLKDEYNPSMRKKFSGLV